MILICYYFHKKIETPAMCPVYQTGSYNITVYDSADHLLKSFGPEVYIQENEETKTLTVNNLRIFLTQGQLYYEIIVTTESIGASISNTTSFISKSILWHTLHNHFIDKIS